MRGDRSPFSATELAQLSRCEQQVLFDARYGSKRLERWRARASEGDAVHAELHRRVTRPPAKGKKPMLIIGILIALAVLLLLLLSGQGRADTDALLPDELRGAELVMSEKSLVRKKPVHVRGRPDEVWQKNGRRYIVETKSREGRVFEGDRMQLAAYAYLLRGDGGPPLAPHGYIRFTGGEQSFSKVKLRPDDAVIDAHRRLQRLRAGREAPEYARQAALCRGCGHRDRCPEAKA